MPYPIVRDLDSGVYYLKGDSGKLLLGAFEDESKTLASELARRTPAFLMFDEDWEHAQPMLEAGIRRATGRSPEQGITSLHERARDPFTPDTRQLMGETPAV